MDGMGPRGAPRPDMYHRGKSHEELKAMTDAGEPAVSQGIADQWRSMGDGLEEAGRMLRDAVSGSESGWSGLAADAMRYRLGQVADWSMSTGQGFTAASSAVGEQGGAVGEAKTRMPEPVPYNPGQIIDEAGASGLLGIMALPQRLYSQKQKHDAAYDEAVFVVGARDAHLATGAAVIPAFTTPPALNDDGGDPGDDGADRRGTGGEPGGGPDGDPGSAPAGGPGSTSQGPGPTTTGPTGPGRGDPGLTTPGFHPSGPPGGGPGGPGGGIGQGSGAPGAGPGGFVPGGGFGSGGGAGGGSGGGGARGGGPGAGGPGRGPGGATGLGPGASAEAAGGGRGAAGARGGAGMAGMPMGAGRGRGDEDTEHERPAYLQEADPESLFGTDEVTAPPVIGEEDEE
jgi:hypothetical protein